jgi:mannose-P-dolichol utilization defect protein 1
MTYVVFAWSGLFVTSFQLPHVKTIRRINTGVITKSKLPLSLHILKSSSHYVDKSSDLGIRSVPVKSNSTITFEKIAAKGLGYAMGLGAVGLHSPMIYSLIRYKNTNGMSIESWTFSLVGITLAMFQPYRKGYPLSTYVELIAIAVQCAGILGLISFYRGNLLEYLVFMTLYLISSTVLFTTSNISAKVAQAVQIVSLILCNYSNIPQIILSFQTKSSSWSAITALFSMTGCAVRVFTTLSLTGDRLALLGYLLGVVSNGVLLAQVVMYGKK